MQTMMEGLRCIQWRNITKDLKELETEGAIFFSNSDSEVLKKLFLIRELREPFQNSMECLQ